MQDRKVQTNRIFRILSRSLYHNEVKYPVLELVVESFRFFHNSTDYDSLYFAYRCEKNHHFGVHLSLETVSRQMRVASLHLYKQRGPEFHKKLTVTRLT